MALVLVVEDGTGLATANSYATVAEANTYHETILYSSDWTGAVVAGSPDDVSQQEKALVWATRLLDQSCNWLGSPATETQALRFPRSGLSTPDGVLLDADAVPQWLKYATAEFARLLIVSDRPGEADEREVVARSDGTSPVSTSVRFAEGGSTRRRVLPASVRLMVAPYCRIGSATIVRT